MYDLLKTKLIKKLDTGLKEATSIAVHPGGMNIYYKEVSVILLVINAENHSSVLFFCAQSMQVII